MKTLKAITLSMAASLGVVMATSATADLWARETIMTRDMTFYTPHELDLSGSSATPAVFIFDNAASSGAEIAAKFRLWEFSKDKGFKVVFVGGAQAGPKGLEPKELFENLIDGSISEGFVDPQNLFIVGYGSDADRAFSYACRNPGKIRGIVAIDYKGAEGSLACSDTSGLVVLSIHDGQPPAGGTSYSDNGSDLSPVDDTLDIVADAGAVVQRVALTNQNARYPDIAAKFFDEKKTSLEKLTAYFVEHTMVK